MSARSRSPQFSPAGQGPATGHRDQKDTVSPASRREDTPRIRSGQGTSRPCRRAHWSAAKTPLTSVAVVSTASAPVRAAIRRARSLAPPRWPDRMGTAYRPASSTTTTAGSVLL